MKSAGRIAVLSVWLASLAWAVGWSRPGASLRGFFPATAARELELEKVFRGLPTPSAARRDLWKLTQVPHVAGTPENYRTARYVLNEFRKAGLKGRIRQYHVLLPMPKQVQVDLLKPFRRTGPTPERGLRGDGRSPDSGVVLPFNAYSPSGDVTAPVVYANYGTLEDYEQLDEMGVDVAGKIVLVRYGRCFRGVKASLAEGRGAAGLLIYSDPAEDGYRRGDVYPRGPWRPATEVQRGSILYHTEYIGDPLTPGVPATADAKRLGLREARTLPRIPTSPISYEDASPILENLGGPVAPSEWQGALPFVYHVGPGASEVRLKLEMDFQIRPIRNVVAEIPGSTEAEMLVVIGNHRDAWTYGAVDPSSGTAALLGVARGLGHLLKQGWKPHRTMILASWDAEEFGLIGSTEWVEEEAERLERHAVAYLNVDIGVAGTHFGASAVPSLGRLVREVAQEVIDPATGQPLYAVWSRESRRLRRDAGIPVVVAAGESASDAGATEAQIGELGGGSDYAPFLQHLGIPSLDLGFGGPYGVYHGIHDDFRWMKKFGDPTFRYSVAVAQVLGTLALRLAESDFLPFEYQDCGLAIEDYLRNLEEETGKGNGAVRLAFEEATEAAVRFTETAKVLSGRLAEFSARGGADLRCSTMLNRALLEVERAFLLESGLPGRPWFRHALYAPGPYTGYAAVVLPGVREAIERDDWPGAADQLAALRRAVTRATLTLNRALGVLEACHR